jgi:hypothetical protein
MLVLFFIIPHLAVFLSVYLKKTARGHFCPRAIIPKDGVGSVKKKTMAETIVWGKRYWALE